MNAAVKTAFSEEFSLDEVEVICYITLQDFHEGHYINYDLSFIELEALTDSSFLSINKRHYNWNVMKLVLLVERKSLDRLSKLFEKLQEEDLQMEMDYITIDNYSNQLIGLSCISYCKESLNLER